MAKKFEVIKSFNYAIDGIIHTLKSQRNMKIHYFIALLVLFGSLFFNLTKIEIIMVFFSITMVIVAEMINTAIESSIDLVTTEYRPQAKIGKDVAAGAVLITGLNALVVGYLVFFDKLSPVTLSFLLKIKNQDIHITVIGIVITLILVIGGKTLSQKGSHVQGGIISGHTALAFALATAVSFISENVIVATLSFLMALLVAQSRVEGKIHSLREVIYGGLLGIMVMNLLFQLLF